MWGKSTVTATTAAVAPPPSPFFHPSSPERVVIEQTVATPRGGHQQTRNVVVEIDGKVHEHKSGIFGCAANMMTCIVGSGIVGLPYAMQQTGFVAGICLIFLTAALTEKSLRLLIETGKHLHVSSYERSAEVAFGVVGFKFILINMFIMAYGAMVTYLMITKTCASLLLGIENATQQQFILLAVSMVIQLPLACMRDMADLEKTSGLAVAIDCTIVALVAYASPWMELGGVEANNLMQLIGTDVVHTDTLFVGLGVLSFAFECQEAAFLVAGSLEKPTAASWGKVTSITLTACVSLAMACALTGYLGFGDATKESRTSFIAHGMLGVTMFATYPLASFVARHVCVVLLFEGRQAREGGDDSSILNRWDRRFFLTFALYIAAMIPATIYTDMGKVLAFAGVIGGSCLAYIGPGLLYLAVHGGRFLELVDAFFYVPIGGDDEERLASETTGLVGESKDDGNSAESPRVIDGFLKTLIWYLGCMPLWCCVADNGKRLVLNHAATLAANNTLEHLRIGDVDHSGIEKLVENGRHKPRATVDSNKSGVVISAAHLIRPLSHPDLREAGAVRSIDLSKMSFEQKKAPHSVQSLEPDPQEKSPGWLDFGIAVFFFCFGCLALFAGLFSLVADQSDDEQPPETVVPPSL